jgi:hypothetical protein
MTTKSQVLVKKLEVQLEVDVIELLGRCQQTDSVW